MRDYIIIIDLKTNEVLCKYRGDYFFKNISDNDFYFSEVVESISEAQYETELFEGRVLEYKKVYVKV